jgi:hypothetical protein
MKKLMPQAVETVNNYAILEPLSDNIKKLAKFRAAETIADVVMQLIENRIKK